MDWDSPEARYELIQRVGITEYNRLILEHHEKSTVATVNGYRIRPVGTRFGRLFMIDGAAVAFQTLEQATAHAATLPTAKGGEQ
jgi:hypothetical protein